MFESEEQALANLAEQKQAINTALLKDYLYKIITNKVVYINGKVVRASDVTCTLCLDVEELDFGDVKITINPMAFNRSIVYSSATLKVYENDKVTLNDKILVHSSKETLNFVSQLTNIQIEKLISALEPIVSEIDKEVSLIDEEAKVLELAERNNLIKNIKKNIQSKMKFDKLTVSELKQLNKLVEKALVKKRL